MFLLNLDCGVHKTILLHFHNFIPVLKISIFSIFSFVFIDNFLSEQCFVFFMFVINMKINHSYNQELFYCYFYFWINLKIVFS